MENVIKYATINSLGTALYIIFVISSIHFLSQYFGEIESIIVPILMLMLFVFSAAFTGTLVFGRPIIWYLDGRKKEALALLFYTLVIFMLLTVVAFLVLVIGQKI